MSLNDFEIIKRLGEGAYSSVYHVRRIADGDYYALKKVRMQKLSDKEKENALNEVRILASIRHPNIVAYKEAFIDEASQSLCIVMEYADSGDLFQQICDHQKNNTLFKEDDIWKIFIQMVRGLRCLHEILIFHRDLKSANVFLNKDGSAKLGDMNVSKVAKKGMLYTQTGTPYYASPEVWRDQPYDNKSDIWSLGCVLYESITLKPPFRADDMQGLYKKVLRGVYPKIPNVYSTDLANLVKALIQVTPQMRPGCERILEMPIIRKRMEKLFPTTDEFYDSQSSLLNTIRVPKNLLYLTDRLPKPSYESPQQMKKRLEEEDRRRKTHDAGNMLPEIKGQNKQSSKIDKRKNAANADQQSSLPPTTTTGQKAGADSQQQPAQSKDTAGKKTRKPNNKSVRVRSDLRQQDEGGHTDNYTADEEKPPAKATSGAHAQVDEDRKSVVSKGSALNQSQVQTVVQSQRDNNQPTRKNTKKERQIAVSHRVRDHAVEKEPVNEEYEDEQFEREDVVPNYSPPPKASHMHSDESHEHSASPNQYTGPSPSTKRTNITKIIPNHQHANQQALVSGGPPSHPVPNGSLILQNRPQVNYSLNSVGALSNPGAGSNLPGVHSVERIYIQKGSSLPSLADQQSQHSQSKKNLAYINISGEGAKPVGYLGIKKAEKDLIMRRYKYNHHVSDNIQRVALIYGNPYSGGSHGNHQPQYQINYGERTGNSHSVSPYLQSQAAQMQGLNNVSGIIKRNKYGGAQQIIEEVNQGMLGGGRGSLGQDHMKLPKLSSLNRQSNNLDPNGINQQSQAMLPPLGANSIGSINGQGLLTKSQAQQQLLHQQQQLLQQQIGVGQPPLAPNAAGYQPYILKPAKLKTITKPTLGPSQGVSQERGPQSLGKYGGSNILAGHPPVTSESPLLQPIGGGSSVSRSHILQSVNNSQASNAETQQQQKELRQIYQRKNKAGAGAGAGAKPAGSRGNRNISQGGVNAGGSTSDMNGEGAAGATVSGPDNNYE